MGARQHHHAAAAVVREITEDRGVLDRCIDRVILGIKRDATPRAQGVRLIEADVAAEMERAKQNEKLLKEEVSRQQQENEALKAHFQVELALIRVSVSSNDK